MSGKAKKKERTHLVAFDASLPDEFNTFMCESVVGNNQSWRAPKGGRASAQILQTYVVSGRYEN
jgi:hypothetical protein